MVLRVEDLEIYRMAEELSDIVWDICIKWDYFPKSTTGKQLVRSADSISANLSEGHGRFHFKERINFCYFARGSLEETKVWVAKAKRRNLIPEDHTRLTQLLDELPIKLNAYIKSIRNAYDKNRY
ncbi:hypothetical protein D3OALGA1CA_3476 [Olavius algarvensis associated proteobacterium Delta 3]|nr:hypothetical protein D3OALGB2SA_3826 [Olavius algarvensis associated proteobacterium Delta 3]CAB5134957.1 hypothetical protein D3OALGA1CA_3476 [Olavius algarvensis associated proteobacterium Delta 3]